MGNLFGGWGGLSDLDASFLSRRHASEQTIWSGKLAIEMLSNNRKVNDQTSQHFFDWR